MAVPCDDNTSVDPSGNWAIGHKAWTTIFVAFVARLVDMSRTTAFVVVVAVTTHNALYTAALAILSIVPTIILGPWVGVLIDRYRPSTIISFSLGVQAVVAAALAYCWLNEYRQIWVLLLAALILGSTRAFTDNSLNVLLPFVTVSDKIHRANGLMSTGQSVSSIAGPALGSTLALASPVGLFTGWALSSAVIAMVAIFVLRTPSFGEAVGTESPARLRDGFVWISHHPPIRKLLIVVTASNVAYGMLSAVIALFALETMHLDARLFGLLTSTLALAGLAGSALITALSTVRLRTLLWASLGLQALGFTLLATTWSIASLFVFYGLIGLASGMWNVASSTVLMQSIPKDVMGRVMATYRSIAFLGSPVGSAVGGPLGDVNLRLPLIAASTVTVLSLLVYARTPEVRRGTAPDSSGHGPDLIK